MNKIITSLIVLVFLVGCGGKDDDSNTTTLKVVDDIKIVEKVNGSTKFKRGNFSKEYFGKWLRVDTKEEVEILSSTHIENYDIESKNLIKVNEDDTTYYLMRAGLSDIVVNGVVTTIKTDSSLNKAPSKIGSVNVVLENVLDSNIKESVKTESDGSFKTSILPAGTYNLSLNNEKISTVTISKPIEDIGAYKLTGDNLYNFKAELILDDEFLYADEKVHTAKVRIHNISNQVGYGLFYTLNIKDENLKSFTNDFVKGSIEAKQYVDIPIHFAFNQITKNSKTISVDVTITDVKNHKWVDSFTIPLYKGYFSVNIATEEDRVKGYVIMPKTHKVKSIDIGGYGTIILPLISNDKYHLLLSNPSFENETAYSLGINKATQDFKTFNYTPAHEPNDKEELASSIALNENVVSYLHATDLDYWKIAMPESEYLFDFTLGQFNSVEAKLSEIVTSNAITITSKLTQDKNISAEVDNGTLVINGIDTNTTKTTLKTGDTLAIKLQAPSVLGKRAKSTLLIGQNSLIFIVGTDVTAPQFTSSQTFRLTAKNNTFIGTVQANDQHKVIYTIENSNNSYLFTIDKDSGKLSFITKPDYELDFNYQVSIKASDIFNNTTIQNIVIKYDKYTRDINNIVTDNYTGYMWQDNIIKKTTWDLGVEYCDGLTLGGYEDWQLPSFLVLSGIVDDSRSNPSISPIFQNVSNSSYWSDSKYNTYSSYYISFRYGEIISGSKNNNYYIRCYRDGN